MSDITIKIENLSKLYRLGEVGTGTISHDLNRWWARFRGKEDPFSQVGQINDRTKKAESDFVWALKGVNLKVRKGEILGIIGKNGAGKSTLLKLISRITSPTTGSIRVKGRIASLLEVGTGMHPEMTAKENIFLNGAIMGMRHDEIRNCFDEIVEFAGCAMYVSTPIKRFSSGMRVRLGFSVAAFLEQEVLIVDEVLAVGDASFQKKAIGKMKEVSQNKGRTVLFVSHNMASIQNLTSRLVLLENGCVSYDGEVDNGIKMYLNSIVSNIEKVKLKERLDRIGSRELMFVDYKVVGEGNISRDFVVLGEDVYVKLYYESIKMIKNPIVIIQIVNSLNRIVLNSSNVVTGNIFNEINKKGCFVLRIPCFPFLPDTYTFNLRCVGGHYENTLDEIKNAGEIKVHDGDFFNTGKTPRMIDGGALVRHQWGVEHV